MNQWQQLGAFVNKVEDLSDDALVRFKAAGGRWIVPLLYGDKAVEVENRNRLPDLKKRCMVYGLAVGGWFNCWGDRPEKDSAVISGITKVNELSPVILDLEGAYQYPNGNPALMPQLVGSLRKKLSSTWNIGVSTNGMNNSMIWNDFYSMGVRVLPQWYSWVYQQDGANRPDAQMAWLKKNGAADPNFRNSHGPFGRGLPLSYVHGTLESTGIEGANLADEIRWVNDARVSGYTKGISIYLLERMPDPDFILLAAQRGKLFVS